MGINNLLENLYLDNNRELQHDFGPRVHEGPIRRRNAARQSFIARDNSNRRIEATLVAHLHSHTDCITGLAVAPDHSFFVSASDDGSVKIWDTARLERSVTSKPRHTYTQHHARVKSLCTIEGVHCFASAAEDGSVHVVRVHVNALGSLPKYGKLSVVREHRVESPREYVTCMSHYNTGALFVRVARVRVGKLNYWLRWGVEFGVRDHPFSRRHAGSADDASVTTAGEPPSFRLYHVYVYGSKTDVGPCGYIVGGALALGQTVWFATQELASGSIWGWSNSAGTPVCRAPHERQGTLGDCRGRDVERQSRADAVNADRSVGH